MKSRTSIGVIFLLAILVEWMGSALAETKTLVKPSSQPAPLYGEQVVGNAADLFKVWSEREHYSLDRFTDESKARAFKELSNYTIVLVEEIQQDEHGAYQLKNSDLKPRIVIRMPDNFHPVGTLIVNQFDPLSRLDGKKQIYLNFDWNVQKGHGLVFKGPLAAEGLGFEWMNPVLLDASKIQGVPVAKENRAQSSTEPTR